MNIGIDIDNTITDVQEKLNNAAFEYARWLGKDIDNSVSLEEDINNDGEVYIKKFKFNCDELRHFLTDIQEEIGKNAEPREGAVETIKKLRKDGHKIFIVTARDSEYHEDPYLLSKNWLDKNNIEYDKLIVNARNKAPVCKNENIDVFIDDQLGNCLKVAETGIKVIRFGDGYKNIIGINNWNEIYRFLGELK